jgi:hypothetical protein
VKLLVLLLWIKGYERVAAKAIQQTFVQENLQSGNVKRSLVL